ncbi:hypothetical protein [Coraliomargarita parva]|uniref:hypothetical protein n=1 Tax=Coraliomargarita parva TaxID=3014050 RepID=UPI0022B3D70D|nr:hypothetical protein [Coraliomargarita parva]
MNTKGEIEFLRTYKDFIYHFNLLDRNMGYCLRYCLQRNGNESPEKWLSQSFDSKRKRILGLADEHDLNETFSEWNSRLEGIRHFRNIISHGAWEWKRWLSEPIHYHAPEIENGKGTLSLDAFEDKFFELKKCADEFSDIRTSLEISVEKMTQQPA